MEFSFTQAEETFREELRAFLRNELPPGWTGGTEDWDDDVFPVAQRMRKKLAARGWLTMGWPREYGGMGAGPVAQAIFGEEMLYHRAPGRDQFGLRMLGPTLMLHGTEEQKREHLPRIAKGERLWCQGYSEPGAGSDLASLQTRATRDGDDYVISGSKTWTTGAHRADWMFLLARTDPAAPKHKGITFLLMDMRSPGVSVRPLVNMVGNHAFNQVFFDDVRVPGTNVVGEINRGWYVAMALLSFERSGVEHVGAARRLLDDITSAAREMRRDGRPLTDDPIVRHKLAERAVETQVARALAYRVAWLQSKGQVPAYESSVSKVFGTELNQRIANTGMQVLGLHAQVEKGCPRAVLDGALRSYYLYTVAPTIYAGSSEVQRNIIADKGLGLPRA